MVRLLAHRYQMVSSFQRGQIVTIEELSQTTREGEINIGALDSSSEAQSNI